MVLALPSERRDSYVNQYPYCLPIHRLAPVRAVWKFISTPFVARYRALRFLRRSRSVRIPSM